MALQAYCLKTMGFQTVYTNCINNSIRDSPSCIKFMNTINI